MINKIKLIITDVDGVLTDGSLYIGKDGIEYKKFSVLDGAAVKYAKFAKIEIAVISGRYSDATTSRMKELGLNKLCFQDALNKIKPYEEIRKKLDLDHDEIAYIGDDLIDIPVLEKVGLPICSNDAHEYVKKISKFCTESKGGDGVFREVVEYILKGQGRFEETLNSIKEQIYKK